MESHLIHMQTKKIVGKYLLPMTELRTTILKLESSSPRYSGSSVKGMR